MLQPFQEDVTSTTLTRVLSQPLSKGRRRLGRGTGPLCEDHPVPFNVMFSAASRTPGASFTGVHVEVSWSIGGARQTRHVLVGDEAKRISGRACNVEIRVALRSSSESAHFVGAVAWDPDAGTEVSPGQVTNLLLTHTLSFAQATSDDAIDGPATLTGSPLTLNSDTRRIRVAAHGLTGGTSGITVPVQVVVFGRRFVDNTQLVRLGSFVVSPDDSGEGVGGDGVTVDVIPTEYQGLSYQVVGFPSFGGGSSTLEVWEEMDPD